MPDIWLSALIIMGLDINALSLFVGLRHLYYLQKPRVHKPAIISLILPLAGHTGGLPKLTAALNRQTLMPRRLIVAVEAEDDPAYNRAISVKSSADFPIKIVVAGEAVSQAQKCTNLLAAAKLGDEKDEAIALSR